MNAFFIEPDRWPAHASRDREVLLQGSEALHLLKVLRLKNGEKVWCTDGRGNSGVFAVSRSDKHKAWLQPLELEHTPRPASSAVLAVGWSKSLRRGWLLEKAVELETQGLWLWQARHSQGKAPAEVKDSWRGQCIAGAKQSRNPWLPELEVLPGGAKELAQRLPAFAQAFVLWEEPGHQRLLTAEDLAGQGLSQESVQEAYQGATLFIVGPEGGFVPEEVRLLQQAGATAVSLGSRVLRWETAALLCLGLHWWVRQLICHAPHRSEP